MAKGKRKRGGKPVSVPSPLPRQLLQVNPDAAGIDIGAQTHYVAVPAERDMQSVKNFGAFTADLHQLADWLTACGIKTVAMESTGIYWIALYELLESRGFEVLLVNPKHVRMVPGRKTDVLDCQWLQQLHTYGLLAPSFRPADAICVLRSYLRQRTMLVEQAAAHIQHMQKALTQMNLKLQHVVSDITGVTGLKIIDAILAGVRDPGQLAVLRHELCKNDAQTIALALQGNWRDEHLFALRQARELYTIYHQKIADCDRQIQAHLSTLPSHQDADSSGHQMSPARGQGKPRKNQLTFAAQGQLMRISGVDLTQIDGLQEHTVLKILSETGVDMLRWRTEKHFASWLGLSPGNKKTGGRQFSGRRRPSSNRAATFFRLAAQTLHHSTSALGAFLRRLKSRLGPAKAITATARKLALLFYRMLRYGKSYVDPGQAYYEQQHKDRLLQNLKRRAKQLGYELTRNNSINPEPGAA